MSKGTINKVMLIGRLGNDPEIRTITSGAKVATLSLATNESYKKGDEWQETTEWHRIILWRNRAEFAEKYIKKGMRIYVEGKLQTRQWQDKNGNQRYTTEVIGTHTELLEPKSQQGSYDQSPPAPQESDFNNMPEAMDDSAPNDDIPF
ncbi:MAG: single-stranded DNA-binding protein [Calditrichia bacterium]|nr:single-stranded DNA-binding protein [Calditrichia bacterium]